MRGVTDKKDCIVVIRKCLESDLGRIDYWAASFDLPDAAIAKLDEARVAVREAILCLGEAEDVIPDEER